MPLQSLKTKPITQTKEYGIFPVSKQIVKPLLNNDTFQKWLEQRNTIKQYIINEDKLRPYQIEGVNKILNRRGIIGVFDQQRLGKTPMVLFSLSIIKPTSTLIIVPKSLLFNWYEECKKWYTDDVVVIKGTTKQRLKLYSENHKVMIISYTLIHNDFEYIPDIECMIIDEAHRLRNFKGQRSSQSPITIKSILKKSYNTKYRIAITGTPAPNKPDNIYPILHFLYPNIFTSYYYFVDYYFETKEVYISREQTITEITGFKDNKQEELQDFLDYTTLQRKRINYMKWIPKISKQIVKVNFTKKENDWYKEIVDTYECEELGINCANTLSQMIALRKITCKTEEKYKWIQDYIKDYPDESIIIVSEFTSYIKELYKKTPNSYIITGDTKSSDRLQIQNNFNNKVFNILFANIDCIKEGMKFEECATMIILDPSLTYTDNEQLEDRIIPTSQEKAIQKEKQQIIYLITENSIDEYIRMQLNQKKTKVEIINDFNKFIH